MKKVMFPFSISYFIIQIILFLFMSACIYLIIVLDPLWDKLIALVGIVLFALELFVLLWSRIVLTDEYIYTPSDLMFKFEKIQYKTKIYYKDIIDFYIIKSSNNSKNKPIRNIFVSSKVQKTYLEFKLKDSKIERICINHYSDKRRQFIMETIRRHMSVEKCE